MSESRGGERPTRIVLSILHWVLNKAAHQDIWALHQTEPQNLSEEASIRVFFTTGSLGNSTVQPRLRSTQETGWKTEVAGWKSLTLHLCALDVYGSLPLIYFPTGKVLLISQGPDQICLLGTHPRDRPLGSFPGENAGLYPLFGGLALTSQTALFISAFSSWALPGSEVRWLISPTSCSPAQYECTIDAYSTLGVLHFTPFRMKTPK